MKTPARRLLFVLISIVCLSLYVNSQQTNPRLIVRADDMGAFHSVNVASIESYVNGVETSVEVMPVTPWFPEAVKMLRENPGLDVGLHLTLTSEWENIKWRPLTDCPSLTDENGYFYPKLGTNQSYAEIEREFRAQIELAVRNIPQISHITGHMGATGFDPQIVALVKRLADEYNLPTVDWAGAAEQYNFTRVGYDGAKATSAEKEASFIRMLEKLEPGKSYMFLDHPAFNNDEMQTVGHVGYEDVAVDRQGVTDVFTSSKVKQVIEDKGIELISYNDLLKSLPRSTPAAEKVQETAT